MPWRSCHRVFDLMVASDVCKGSSSLTQLRCPGLCTLTLPLGFQFQRVMPAAAGSHRPARPFETEPTGTNPASKFRVKKNS